MSFPVVILAGGLATRLRPLTEKIPKALVEVAGRPFLEHQLDLLKQNSIAEVILCLGYLGEMIEQRYGDGEAFGVRIRYSFDGPILLGTGGAIKRASALLLDAFFVLYGDSNRFPRRPCGTRSTVVQAFRFAVSEASALPSQEVSEASPLCPPRSKRSAPLCSF